MTEEPGSFKSYRKNSELFSLSDLTREPRTVALMRAVNGSTDIPADSGLEGAADFDFGAVDGSGDFPTNGDGLAT